jgi:hypothetical protein
MKTIHITPVDDLIEHENNDSCACGPNPKSVKRDDGSIGWYYVHNSLDGRERFE